MVGACSNAIWGVQSIRLFCRLFQGLCGLFWHQGQHWFSSIYGSAVGSRVACSRFKGGSGRRHSLDSSFMGYRLWWSWKYVAAEKVQCEGSLRWVSGTLKWEWFMSRPSDSLCWLVSSYIGFRPRSFDSDRVHGGTSSGLLWVLISLGLGVRLLCFSLCLRWNGFSCLIWGLWYPFLPHNFSVC